MAIEKKGMTPLERLAQNQKGYVVQTPEMKGAGYATVTPKAPRTRGVFGEDPRRVKDKARKM